MKIRNCLMCASNRASFAWFEIRVHRTASLHRGGAIFSKQTKEEETFSKSKVTIFQTHIFIQIYEQAIVGIPKT